MGKYSQSEELYFYITWSFPYVIVDKLLLLFSMIFSTHPFHKGFFTLYSSFQIILTLHLSLIWYFTWVPVLSVTSSGSLWVVVTKVSLFRCILHINATRKVVTVHLMRWQQLFLRSFGLSHLPFKSIGHVLLFWASWKVPLVVGMQIWGMLAMSERIFILGHPSMCFLPTGPYAGRLLCTGNLLRQFIVLGQAHGPTYYFGPLPPQNIFAND